MIANAMHSDALSEDCERARVIVTSRQAPANCAAAVIDLLPLRRQGALALSRKEDGFAVQAVRPTGFDRRWSPAPSGDAERDEGMPLQPKSRVQDATPAEQDLRPDD